MRTSLKDPLRMDHQNGHAFTAHLPSHGNPCQLRDALCLKEVLFVQFFPNAIHPQKTDDESGVGRDDRFPFSWSLNWTACCTIGLDDDHIDLGRVKKKTNQFWRYPLQFPRLESLTGKGDMAELVNMLQGTLFQFLLVGMDKEARGFL